MSDELDALRERVQALEDELDALKADADTGTTDGDAGGRQTFTDARDAAVVDALEPGQKVSAQQLRSLYQQRTDVRNESTLRSRLKRLTKTPLFKHEKSGWWTFVGEDADE